MHAPLEGLSQIACSTVPLLIVGEPGTGKRTLAYRIHELSQRSGHMAEVTCADIASDHADPDPRSFFVLSGAATVYLSEITGLQAPYQLGLLEALNRYGDDHKWPRVIASTGRSLEEEIHTGRFREDLYYLLSGICLRVPPLRHRREDIPVLVDHFLERYSLLFGRSKPVLSQSTLRFLFEHDWPGNVRQLEDAVKTIVAVGDERVAMLALRSSMLPGNHDAGHTPSLKEKAREASRQVERELILKVLSRTRWNRKRAAEELRISYKALLYKLKQIGLDDYMDSSLNRE